MAQLDQSHLARLWNKIKEKDGRAVVDFEAYAPSNGEPACFAGAPPAAAAPGADP